MSYRAIIRQSHNTTVGYIQNEKGVGRLVWESMFERDAIYLFLFYPTILSMAAQSYELEFRKADGKMGKAYPDLYVETIYGPEFVEVKPDSIFKNPKEMDRLKRVAQAAREGGVQYHLVTESVIRRKSRFPLVKAFYRYRKFLLTQEHFDALAHLARSSSVWKFSTMVTAFGKNGLEAVYCFLGRGQLRIDLLKPLSSDTLVLIVISPQDQADHSEIYAEGISL